MSTRADTIWIEKQAKELGFDLCGVARAELFPELQRMEEWLARGYAGEMKYLGDERRSDPRKAMEGVRSVIVCALNYNAGYPRSTDAATHADAPAQAGYDDPRGWISRYAWGDDYHDVLREKLDALMLALQARFPGTIETRTYADTGPMHERALAKHAGLGWIGKNTLLLNQKIGSLFFLGVILTTLELAPSLEEAAAPPPDLCGTCRRCLDACPTGAFVEPYVLDARRCIAYLTIEHRGSIPEDLRQPMGRHVFGCDICQDVCPWNRRAPMTLAEQFQPRTFATENAASAAEENTPQRESLFLPRLEWLAGMSEEEYRRAFRGSPIKRAKWRGLLRNACIALGNADLKLDTPAYARIHGLLQRLAASGEPVIAESALWALSRIQTDSSP